MSPYEYGCTNPRYTYLVGPEDSFTRYISEHGVKDADLFVRRLATVSAAKALRPGDPVIFLKMWRTLPEGMKIARHVAALRAVALGVI